MCLKLFGMLRGIACHFDLRRGHRGGCVSGTPTSKLEMGKERAADCLASPPCRRRWSTRRASPFFSLKIHRFESTNEAAAVILVADGMWNITRASSNFIELIRLDTFLRAPTA